jgi:predicted acyltransferase
MSTAPQLSYSPRLDSPPLPVEPPRLASLDVFRGLTLAGMILVNHPGTWTYVYPPLRHAEWNGWTPTDLVFPSFLFIVGVAITLAFEKRLARGDPPKLLLLHALRRSMVLFMLGMAYSGFANEYISGVVNRTAGGQSHWYLLVPYGLAVLALGILWPDEGRIARRGWATAPRITVALFVLMAGLFNFWYYFRDFQLSHLRVPGILQRIAVCYFLASAVVLLFGARMRVLIAAACLIGYWAILRYVHAPAGYAPPSLKDPSGLLHAWVDSQILGTHVYSHELPDPEGLLSTLPALATTLMGVLAGQWLRSRRGQEPKAAGLLLVGLIAIVVGLAFNPWMPINKKIWTDSYVLFAGGISLYLLGACYLLVDVQGWRRWATPFLVLGTNTIVIYLLSGLVGYLLTIGYPLRDGGFFSPKAWLWQHHLAPTPLGPTGGSLAYALLYVLFWMVIFYPLYRAKVYIRV